MKFDEDPCVSEACRALLSVLRFRLLRTARVQRLEAPRPQGLQAPRPGSRRARRCSSRGSQPGLTRQVRRKRSSEAKGSCVRRVSRVSFKASARAPQSPSLGTEAFGDRIHQYICAATA